MINYDLLRVVDAASVDVDSDGHVFAFNVENVPSLVHNYQLFVQLWIYLHIVQVSLG